MRSPIGSKHRPPTRDLRRTTAPHRDRAGVGDARWCARRTRAQFDAVHNDVWWNVAGECPVRVLDMEDPVRWHTFDTDRTVQHTDALAFIRSHLPMYVARL